MSFDQEFEKSRLLEQEALDKCNEEPIQTPGSIQAYGALLAFEFDSLKVTYASENITAFISLPERFYDCPINELFSKTDFHAIANIASHSSAYRQQEYVKVIQGHRCMLEVSLYRTEHQVVLEFIPQINISANVEINAHVKWVMDQVKNAQTVDEILNTTVQSLQLITQFDRVKAYKFSPDDSGTVVAEANNGKMESYLGLSFPAFDIPPIARALFLKTPIRYIYSTFEDTVPITKYRDDLPPLDMSQGLLRGVSPVHLQYLRNMGVKATLTLPIVVNGKLWGLFAHHHSEEKIISSAICYSAQLIGQLVSLVLASKINFMIEERIKNLQLEGDDLITINQNDAHLKKFWKNYSDKLKELIPCDGLAYQIGTTILTHGDCPNQDKIVQLGAYLRDHKLAPVFHTHNLKSLGFESLSHIRGLLSIIVHDHKPTAVIYFFRNEIIKKIIWAGDPKKHLEVDEAGVRLHPRGSFKHFEELHKDQSEHWDSETVSMAEAVLLKFTKVIAHEKLISERFKIIVQELNHRIRNLLAMVRSISRQSISNHDKIEDYVDALEERILALAKANNLLTSKYNMPIDFLSLLKEVVLGLYSNAAQIHFSGEQVQLNPEIIPTITLILHELTTNSIKYGALSVANGELDIHWKKSEVGLIIEWKERNGPAVSVPTNTGFGTVLIANAIKHEFGGRAKVTYEKDGLHANFLIPDAFLGNDTNLPKFVFKQIENEQAASIMSFKEGDLNVLIVEDDFINAQEIKEIVNKFQIKTIDVHSNQNDALVALHERRYHLAFLDVNLLNGTSRAVAQECRRQNIVFYYLTGYDASFLLDGTFPQGPVLQKPVKSQKINQIILNHIASDG